MAWKPPRGRRFVPALLRLPPDLHASLAGAAAQAGVSFNEFCIRRLAAPEAPDSRSPARGIVVDRAISVFGEHLVGVVALGSWIRGEATAGSDIDALVVIDSSVPLTRELYRRWDETPLVFEGRPIDAHFTHLSPAPIEGPGAVWCEAAVEGRLWYDRDGGVARRLADVRRAIADGRVVRAVAHGQPYWKGAA
jgi:hypothetical protein